MTVIATCGHDVTDKRQYKVSYMEHTREGERAAAFGLVCEACYTQYDLWGIILHNETEERDWLNGKTEYPA